MTNLQTLLKEKDINRAVIIDDAFDDLPRPDELDEKDWSRFFEDLTEEDILQLETLYPGYENVDQSILRSSEKFITVLWENREKLSQEVAAILFRGYESRNANDRFQLGNLVQRLEDLGLTCTTIGREIDDDVNEADLVVIDLFLGSQSSEKAVERAVKRVRKIVSNRDQTPPLVILVSSSSRLDEKRNKFRDEAELLSSTFRVASKSDLIKDGRLELILSRLVSHYEDAKRVAGFLDAWENGIESTRKNFLQRLRRLDLSDLAQIQTLLLDSEGERLGDYLLDVADRVLQHEIESDPRTIESALELNSIDLSNYPAPHLMGTPDLQDLVHRMAFVHGSRLGLSGENERPHLRFGDVVQCNKNGGEGYGNEVYLVVSPACDLVRNETSPVMLLSGQLMELKSGDWSYREDSVRTSIIILPDGGRKWIKWNLREVESLRYDQLNQLIQDGRLSRIARLREVYSLAIQQKLLARMGRIGQPANLPVPFPITVSLFYVDTDQKACKLLNDDIESAVCYVGRGRDSKDQIYHLVLTEQVCDQIAQALYDLSEEKVCQAARASLRAVKKDPEFIKKFEQGEVEIPPPNKARRKYIKGANNETYATIVRDDKLSGETSIKGADRKAALIIKVADISDDGNH